jgi:RsiW-degrading membrane proteinase PrsW (M82 family)
MFFLIAILAAVAPTLFYTLLIWWLDRYEKEPFPLLVAAFLWGSLPAVVLAIIVMFALETPISNSPLGPGFEVWGLAPLVEEGLKAVALVALFLFARREFDGPLDGIVYGSLIGFGFSMTENLLFFVAYPDNFGGLFWLRSVFFGFNHAFFTSIVGLVLGAVRYAPQRWLGYVALPLALLMAIFMHGLHNYAVNYQLAGIAFSWIVQSSGVAAVLSVAVLAWRHERSWMMQELGEEIALGVISTADYVEVISAPQRARVLFQTLLSGNLTRYQQVVRFYHLITELAFCKYQLRVGDRFQHHAERDRLREEIIVLRAALTRAEEALGL